jgi:hypothetical protein
MLNRNINSIIYQSYIKLGELTYEITLKSKEGFTGTKALNALWLRAIDIDNLLFTIVENAEVVDNEVYRIVGVPDADVNKMLACLESLSGIKNYPVAPFLVSRNVTKLSIAGEGSSGTPGVNGVSSYTAVVFAVDAIGTGMSTTPSPSRPYIAFKTSTQPIAIVPATFAGLWVKYIGDPGIPGNDGVDGTSYYFYVRYASDAGGSGFSATPAQTRKYVAFLSSTVDHLNNPPTNLFAGLWMKYIGDDGQPGVDGKDGNTILCTSGPPSPSIGTDGDVAIDTSGWYIHAPKASGVWPAGVSLIGPMGPAGSNGLDGSNGADGADAYLYIAWADDAAGTGFTMVFDPNKNWIATINTTVDITPTVTDFAGKWAKYRGDGNKWATNSSTVLTIGTGNKSLIVATGLAYTTGQRVVIAVTNDPLNRMEGLVVGYNQVTGNLTVLSTYAFGSGTYSTWDVNLQGVPSVAPTSDSYYGEIYTDTASGTQATSTSFAKLAQFVTNGDFNNGMVPDAANNNITSSVAGEFNLYANLTLASVAGGTFELQIFKNNIALTGLKRSVVLAASQVPVTLSLQGIRSVLANDIYDVRIKADTGTPDIILKDGSFGMFTTGTPSTPEYSLFGGVYNTGAGQIVDSFPANLGDAIVWEYKIKKGTSIKTGRIQGAWNSLGNITENDGYPVSIGTIDVTLSVNVSGGNVNLIAALTSNGWEISGNRYILI